MKNRNKEIILICKHRFNKKNHKDVVSALKQYICDYCGFDVKYLTTEELIDILLDCVNEYCNDKNILNKIIKRLIRNKEYENIELEDNIIYSLCGVLCLLHIRDDKNWIIDMSDYENIDFENEKEDWWLNV